jgi:hypothetical protein
MFLASLSGIVRVDRPKDLTADEIKRRLGHELRQIGLIVMADQPDLVAFAMPAVTDGKTWWWLGWKLFAVVSGGSFGLRDIAHNVVGYNLSLRRLLFTSVACAGLFFILIIPSMAQGNPFPMLIPIGCWLWFYFGNRCLLWFRIRRWIRRVVASPTQPDEA